MLVGTLATRGRPALCRLTLWPPGVVRAEIGVSQKPGGLMLVDTLDPRARPEQWLLAIRIRVVVRSDASWHFGFTRSSRAKPLNDACAQSCPRRH